MTHARTLVHSILFLLFSAFSILTISLSSAQAQSSTWVQIEAHPSLNEAQSRARAYSGAFDNVAGFRIGSGWYVVALGPYTAPGAAQELERLRRENLIPGDSYLADSRGFSQQFWPLGGTQLTQPTPPEEPSGLTEVEPVGTITILPDETPRQARASENALSRSEKMGLQEAMQWEGFYTSAIDGSFGRGTRAAMGDYQSAMGYDVTGILTTNQRTELLEKFNKVFTDAGMTAYRDEKAGISIDLPLGMVAFDNYNAPFVHFKSKDESGVSVSLISQKGDQATLFGLYEIMQTLKIVPTKGERERRENSFVLRGNNAQISSYTYAALDNGTIKGFTLVWPAGDKANMERIVSAMKPSLTSLSNEALDDMAGSNQSEQRIDLASGLEIRKPRFSRSGFYLDAAGTVLTTDEFVGACSSITLGGNGKAEISFADRDLGVAVLRPNRKLAPMGYAMFEPREPRLKSEVAVAGYSYEGALNAPTLTFGTLADVRGLSGEANTQRLDLSPLAGDAGGPVVNAGGAVIGMLRSPAKTDGRTLPENVSFTASAGAISEALSAQGISPAVAEVSAALHPEDLTSKASDMTVLVNCWE